ncbi:hypothetical protein VPH35_043856 [Triticum aestivum]
MVAKLASFNDLTTKALHVLVGSILLNILPRFTCLALVLPEVTTPISPLLNNLPHQIFCLRGRLSTCTRWSIGRGLRIVCDKRVLPIGILSCILMYSIPTFYDRGIFFHD